MAGRTPVAVATDRGDGEEALSPAEELFARLVHDLRNPLGIIESFTEALADAAPEERDDLCARLRLNAQRALHVLEELSLLADLRAGRARPAEWEDTDVDVVIAAVAAAVAAVEHRTAPLCRRSGGPPRAAIAPAHLACALRGLLRQLMHIARSGDEVELAVTVTAAEVTVRIAATVPPPPRGFAAALPQLDLELAAGIAALYGGHCEMERRPGGLTVTLRLGNGAEPHGH